jgi:hypothetical protein
MSGVMGGSAAQWWTLQGGDSNIAGLKTKTKSLQRVFQL